jgi:hypothetical protein
LNIKKSHQINELATAILANNSYNELGQPDNSDIYNGRWRSIAFCDYEEKNTIYNDKSYGYFIKFVLNYNRHGKHYRAIGRGLYQIP